MKTTIITGASKGIGFSAAEHFAAQGWQVINIARTDCQLNNVINLNCDLANPNAIHHLKQPLNELLAEQAQICLVHNACFNQSDNIKQQDEQQLSQACQVNIIAPTMLNRLIIPVMAPHSSIIYIGSTLSEKGVANAASYVISKHVSVGMMRATCQDLAEDGIHTCCVCPGFTETEMLLNHLSRNSIPLSVAKNRVGAKRLIQPEEIANLIYYCAENPIINGEVIHANLGQLEI